MAKVIICADDYAQSAEIDAAILTLIERGILTATSCMTLSPRWPASARQLSPQLRTKADLGLHLDFTQFSQTIRAPHPVLVVRSLLGLLSTQKVMANIKQQLDAFEDALHMPPDYIDGHLHVHQLPIIREALLTILQHRYSHLAPAERPWLRISSPPVGSGLKARMIHWLGAQTFKQLAAAAGFRVSPVLLGVYDFQGDAAAYQAHWLMWARQLKQLLPASDHSLPPVLMCHPARPTRVIDPHDPIAIARMIEWQVMQSADFSAWLAMADVQPVKGLMKGAH
ncbi:ChbG/HpnK family deacetylase [Methylophilus sp. 5]|uniref:ChbG/HpnK family deacetylase n=1 Tax=Methylophilus sp. 5 TaxID=1112274 RepID=UPI00048B3341|nr:ChbG/HpnK family deacetylase [Methylophilus sp. 5]